MNKTLSDQEFFESQAIKSIFPEPKKEPEQVNTPKANREYIFALQIKQGKAGGLYLYCLEDDKFYHYVNGYWESLFFVDFLGKIEQAIPKLVVAPLNSRKQVCENFKQLGRTRLNKFNWSDDINLENGMLSVKDFTIRDHAPDYYSTNRLPYSYDKNAKCELWIKTLNEILENDKERIGVLQEYFGYCLTREIKYHKALLLLGESRSGKSTILHILRKLIGDNNCSSVPLKYLSNPQHTPDLINKLVNIDTDVSSKAQEFEAEFKTITSGEPVRTNQKYVSAFSFVPYCKIVMAANIFPKITDHSSAFYNRLILIPCDRVFTPEEQNRDLPKQLEKELSGILNWAIEGLKRLTGRGRFEELSFMKDAVEELENENNPVNLFFDETLEIYTTGYVYIEKGELFEKYKDWCERTKNFILSQARFASCVFKRYHKVTPKTTNHPETKKRVWRNIRYKIEQPRGEQVSWTD